MTAQPEHSQCPLVEMDSITSLLILLCGIMNTLGSIYKSMEKSYAQLSRMSNNKRQLMMDKLRVVLPPMPHKVSKDCVAFHVI